MIPSPGRVVAYTLTEQDAEQINRRRADPPQAGRDGDGAQIHVGNRVYADDTYPLVITRVWDGDTFATRDTAISGQVLLDGNDTLWVTSRNQDQAADGDMPLPGKWAPYPLVIDHEE